MTRGKNPGRQLQGARAKAQGQQFEARLNAAFEYYRAQGIAAIEKTPEPMRVVKNLGNGKFVAFFEKKAQADYSGVLAGGEAITFEAKYTSTGRLEQSRITPEQSKYLDERYKLCSLCYVLAGFASGRVYRVPWDVWRDMKEWFGRKYVTENDLPGYWLPEMGGWVRVLWKLC